MNTQVKRFSEVAGEHRNIETIPFSQLVGKEVIIYEIDEYASPYGPAFLVTASFADQPDNMFRTIAGGRLVVKQLAAIRQHLPVMARVTRQKSAKGRVFYSLE